MSRKPTSAANVIRANGGDPVPPPPPPAPKALPPKVMRVRVEPSKPKQQTQPGRAEMERRRRRPGKVTRYVPVNEEEQEALTAYLDGYRSSRRWTDMTPDQINDYRTHPGGNR